MLLLDGIAFQSDCATRDKIRQLEIGWLGRLVDNLAYRGKRKGGPSSGKSCKRLATEHLLVYDQTLFHFSCYCKLLVL